MYDLSSKTSTEIYFSLKNVSFIQSMLNRFVFYNPFRQVDKRDTPTGNRMNRLKKAFSDLKIK
jgi:hypothetical protein